MFQTHAMNNRRRLCLSASALAIAVTCFGVAGTANATVTTLSAADAGTVYDMDASTDTAVIIPSGLEAMIIPNWGSWVLGSDPGLATPSGGTSTLSTCIAAWSCKPNAPLITVASGGALRIAGTQTYGSWFASGYIFQSAVAATGDVIIENVGDLQGWGQPSVALIGANSFLGNVTLLDGAHVDMGWNWSVAQTTFGPNSNIELQGASVLTMYQNIATTIGGNIVLGGTSTLSLYQQANTATVSGKISSSSTATFNLGHGTLTANGVNTTTAAFLGTMAVNPGAFLVVGDVTHASALFGDPNASAATITVSQSGGTLGGLLGYGTIYGNVTNGGSVTPGGTAGTLGTLAIHGNYTQSSLGQLTTEVTPTGTSKLTVSGTANVSGSLIVKVNNGTYTTPALYSVLTTSALTGSFNAVSVQGNAAFVGAVRSSTGYSVAVESSTSPQTFAHQAQVNRFNVAEFSRAIFDRLDTKTDPNGKVVGWLSPFGSVESIGRNGLGFSNTTYGVRGGVEYHSLWKNAVIGLAASYGAGSMDVKGEASTADSNTLNVAAYGGVDLLYARIDGSLTLSKFDGTINRSLGTLGTVTSSPEGSTWGASVKVSQDIFNGLVTPFVAGYFARVHLGSVAEAGNASFALRYNAIDKNFMVADLGAKIHVIRQPTLKLDLTLALEHDFSDRGETAVAAFANISGSSATYRWKGDSENTLITSLYLADSITNHVDLFARVNGQFSTVKRAGDFSVGAKYKF